MKYRKKPLTVDEQIDLLQERGLGIEHRDYARRVLWDKNQQDSQGFPIWMMSEMASFGNLSKFYSGLSSENRRAISILYGIPHRLLSQWLHSLVYLRNICAHHARLWNRDMVIAPKKPRDLPEKDFWSKKLFSLLLVLKHLTAPSFNWAGFTEELQKLLQKYPDVDANAMGFPVNWKEVLMGKDAGKRNLYADV
jgi:abortive infection bacteriophage resistance protein